MTSVFKALPIRPGGRSSSCSRRADERRRAGEQSASPSRPCRPISRCCASGLIGSEKDGKHVTYWLNATVLEEALLAFAGALDLNMKPGRAEAPAGEPDARTS